MVPRGMPGTREPVDTDRVSSSQISSATVVRHCERTAGNGRTVELVSDRIGLNVDLGTQSPLSIRTRSGVRVIVILNALFNANVTNGLPSFNTWHQIRS